MENSDNTEIEKPVVDKVKFNEYHKNYYINKIKGIKIICPDCGLMHDKFRGVAHRNTKKHLKYLNLKNENKIL